MQVLAIFKIPKPEKIDFSKLIIALDELNNPGNLGTIIRLCDWYGVKDLICNKDSVDCYNPKVIQSAMGSHSRVNISYLNLEKCLNNTECIMGADLSGDNIYNNELPQKGVLIFGNESNGISPEVLQTFKYKINNSKIWQNKKNRKFKCS
jgi:TrmH family RNA methyltransferase